MRHLKKGRKFHRKRGQRNALLKSLIGNLVLKERMETTEARAKEIRSRTEKLITLGKKKNLAALRLLISRVHKRAAEKIYYDLAPRYKDVKGGYLRIVKSVKMRKADGARMAIIEFV